MNNFIFSGRLGGDPEVRYSSGSKPTAIASFSVAVERDFKRDGEPTADFIKCVCFGKSAEAVEKYLTKGVKIIGVGSVQNNNYEKDGVKHYSMQVILNKWEFAESKKAAAESAESGEQTTTPASESAKPSEDEFMSIPKNLDIDMPFA